MNIIAIITKLRLGVLCAYCFFEHACLIAVRSMLFRGVVLVWLCLGVLFLLFVYLSVYFSFYVVFDVPCLFGSVWVSAPLPFAISRALVCYETRAPVS